MSYRKPCGYHNGLTEDLQMEICDQHRMMMQQLLDHQEFVGRTETKIDNMCKAVNKMDGKIHELHTIAKDNRDGIAELKRVISNGYKEGMAKGRIDQAAESRIKIAEESVPGFSGSLNRAWNRIRDNFAFYLLIGSAFIVAWVLVQEALVHLGLRQYF